MMTISAPRPVKTPPTEVASRHPWAVVSNSGTACRWADRRVGKARWYHPAGEDAAAIAGELVGEILGIADAEDLHAGLTPEAPGRKRDRSQQRFQVARRQVDDQPPDLAVA
jgi:hypothetical protein